MNRAVWTVLLLALPACTDSGGSPPSKGAAAVVDTDGDGTPDDTDCAPDDPAVHPGARETCNDLDDDCDGVVDNDPADGNLYYGDTDGDGHYGDLDVVTACSIPAGYGFEPLDCDDTSPAVYPGAPESCDLVDSDCDGALGADEVDGDGDGFAACEECDDTRADVFPGAAETCNRVDDDCDGDIDEDASWYPDTDGDGYGDREVEPVLADCTEAPEGRVNDGTDCDDTNAAVNPGVEEVCDPDDLDEDCDGLAEEADDSVVGLVAFAPDGDGDGFGDALATPELWCDAPTGMVADATDCDDADSTVYPGASEDGVGLFVDLACDGAGGSLERADYAMLGEAAGDYAGHVVSSAGDVDGDGLADLLVGAYRSDAGATDGGAVYLVLGSSVGASGGTTASLADASLRFIGTTRYERAGLSAAGVGDVDGDGLDDILIGSPYSSPDGSASGAAYLFLGSSLSSMSSGDVDLGDADLVVVGSRPSDQAGAGVAAAGDVDGDGLADIVVGAPGSDGSADQAGESALFYGSSIAAMVPASVGLSDADFRVYGRVRNEKLGSMTRSAGDVDGDGLGDLVLGAPLNEDVGVHAGQAYLVLGRSIAASTSGSLRLTGADFTFVSAGGYDQAGESVGSAGDVDGDGLDDILIGATENDLGARDAGTVYVFLGSTLSTATTDTMFLRRDYDLAMVGTRTNAHAGAAVGSAGDLDGDGLEDVWIGETGYAESGTRTGAVHLVYGASMSFGGGTLQLTDTHLTLFGGPVCEVGASLANAGDVDGDGVEDLLVGSEMCDDVATIAGKAYLVYSEP